MSARNYMSAREKNINKVDYLPYICHQKFCRRSELPVLSANAYNLINRNVNSYNQHFADDYLERSGTPFSDFFSESETGTPDFHSEESDSSAGSVLKRNTAEATKTLADEWKKIERTFYDEDGEKCTRPQIVEECKQWQELHPQLRITGKAIPTSDRRLHFRQIEHDEIIAMHYSDYEKFSESEERLSQSSNDVTPTSSPRNSADNIKSPKLFREKISYVTCGSDIDLSDSFNSLLHITPIQIRSPVHKKRQNQSILRSDVASSKWMRSNRPDSSINLGRNSAKSYISLDARNLRNLNSLEHKKDITNNSLVYTARLSNSSHLQPLYSPESQPGLGKSYNGQPQYNIRKVSLPPLLLEEERRKVAFGSAKVSKQSKYRKSNKSHHFDKVKHA